MKTKLLGLLLLGITNLAYSQTNNSDVKEITLEDVVITSLNANYLSKIQDANTPESVKELENVAARYDITESHLYDNTAEAFRVIFKDTGNSKGRIVATYNSEGKIISSVERYKNVRLPYEVTKAVATSYPGWEIFSDMYLVSFYEATGVKKSYKVQIRKNNTKKNLKVTPNGLVK